MNVLNKIMFVSAAVVSVLLPLDADACTSAIASAGVTRHGRMLMWKHRDSGHPDNFVAKVEATDSTFAYVALFNAGDNDKKEAWVGFNASGFAVMNTASYNLVPDTAKVKDREGLIMTMALQRCRRVEDFAALLDSEIKRGALGVQTNFGVMDAYGNAAYFETSDHSFRTYPLKDEKSGLMVRSNYSYSGGKTGRLGEVRHDNAVQQLEEPLENRTVSPEVFTEYLSRTFYHAGEGEDMAYSGNRYLADLGEYIPRRSSCASVVIESALPNEDPYDGTVMWIAIGFPPVSHVEAVTLDQIPTGLLPYSDSGHSKLCDEANFYRDKVFSKKDADGNWLIDVNYLNSKESGSRLLSIDAYRRGRAQREAAVRRRFGK